MPHPVLAVVAAHLPAAIPDLLVEAGVRQGRWMGVFLGSMSAHYAPAEYLTWALLAFAAAATRAGPSAAGGKARGQATPP